MGPSDRADRVNALIDAYQAVADRRDLSPEATLVRILADLHHYCFHRGLRFDAVLHPARRQFHEELESDPP